MIKNLTSKGNQKIGKIRKLNHHIRVSSCPNKSIYLHSHHKNHNRSHDKRQKTVRYLFFGAKYLRDGSMIRGARFDVGTFLCDGNLRMRDAVKSLRDDKEISSHKNPMFTGSCPFVAQKPLSTSLDSSITEAECKKFLPFRTFLYLCCCICWEFKSLIE